MTSDLDIRGGEASVLASALAALTGESVEEAVMRALQDRLDAERAASLRQNLDEELTRMLRRVASAAAETHPAPTTPERRRQVEAVMARAARMRAESFEPGRSDHGWLYGDDGLPT